MTKSCCLQKKGERNYYEFDIAKSKQFNFEGPMGVRLRKANLKHDYADLELMLDDRSLSQKHVNIYQPVMFYTPDTPQPIELVINSITKDHIRGYVSSPKYRQSELAAMQTANAAAATTAVAGTTTTSQCESGAAEVAGAEIGLFRNEAVVASNAQLRPGAQTSGRFLSSSQISSSEQPQSANGIECRIPASQE